MTSDGGEMWLSTRRIRRAGDPEWDSFIQFVGLTHLREVRTIDSWCNPCQDGNHPVSTLDELWERVNLLPPLSSDSEYHLLFTDALGPNGCVAHSRLKLLGYDLSDETWTSSLLNCGRWQGVLEPIARRTGTNGLLTLEQAKLAQALLPEAWGRPARVRHCMGAVRGLSVQHALEKLRDHALANPAHWILKLVQAGVAARADEIQIKSFRGSTRADIVLATLPPLDELEGALLRRHRNKSGAERP